MALNSLRIAAVLLGLSLMIGEIWRSWGVGRPLVFVLDDQVMGLFLILSALAVRRESLRAQAAFSAAWGFACGMLYLSFFDKVFAPQTTQAGNWTPDVLTVLVGVAFAVAVFGLLLSLILVRR